MLSEPSTTFLNISRIETASGRIGSLPEILEIICSRKGRRTKHELHALFSKYIKLNQIINDPHNKSTKMNLTARAKFYLSSSLLSI